MRKKGLLFGIVSSFLLNAHAQSPQQISQSSALPFLDTTVNLFQSHQASVMGSLVEQLGLKTSSGFDILHVGDELVTDIADPLGDELLGKLRGPGLFFPGCLINQAITPVVDTKHTGFWTYASPVESQRLIPSGITGYAAKTDDWRSSLTVDIPAQFSKGIDRFTMYCERSEHHFDVVISCLGGRKSDGTASILSKKEFPASITYKNTPFLEFTVPAGTKEILIQFKQVISTQKSFVLYGVSLTNSRQGNLHSIAMRGCGYAQFNELELFKQQVTLLSPDLVFLDFGTHDNYRTNDDQAINLEPLRRSILSLKETLPSTKIVVIIPQDGVRGGRTQLSFEKFEQAIIALCKAEKVAYYDWYRIAGGKYAAQYWSDQQLFMVDGMHLQEAGNQLKGHLYARAWEHTQTRYNNGYRQFVIPEDSSKRLAFRTRDTLSKNVVVSEVWRYHVVRRGETAYRIALRYGITVAQLKEWNHLRNYNISAGTRLKVGKLSIATKSDPIQTLEMKDSADADGTSGPAVTAIKDNPKTQDSLQTPAPKKPLPKAETAKPKIIYHKVKSGETLYSISRNYGIGVDTLKRLNGLRSNNIAVGRILRVQ